MRYSLNWVLGALTGPGVLGGLVVLCVVLTAALVYTPYLRELHGTGMLMGSLTTDAYVQNVSWRKFIGAPWTPLFLCGTLLLSGWIIPSKTIRAETELSVVPFVALLFGIGAVLTLGPEFLYLQDGFGTRMNTMFKLYYQAWTLWSIVAAFACWHIRCSASKRYQLVFGMAAVVAVAGGLVYPVMSIWTKTAGLQGTTVVAGERVGTLDGVKHMEQSHKDDHMAIIWLNKFLHYDGVIAESVGGSYSEYGRVSVHTGLPTVLGWPGHELQWRGGFELAAGREEAVQMLYSTQVWDEAVEVLDRYGIRYVYVGSLERKQFSEQELGKFGQYMNPIYRNRGVTIYERIGGK